MTKVTGPLFSMSASGTLGNAITFASKNGVPYVRRRVIPSNPRSGLQTGFRSLFKFLTQDWANLGATPQASWAALAASLSGQNFNAYVHFNQQRLKQFLSPTDTYPVPAADLVGTGGSETATGGVGIVTLTGSIAVANQNWGIMIFRKLGGAVTAAVDNLVAAIPLRTATSWTYVDSPLAPGTWHYNYELFSLGGVKGSARGADSAVVT